MSEVKVGTRWLLWGESRKVLQIRPERIPGYGPEALVPGETRANKPRWNDWVECKRIERYGTPLPDDGEPITEEQRQSTQDYIEAEAKKARKKRIVSPTQKLKNRISATRHRLNNPEKFGRSEWTALEKADMENSMAALEEQVAKL